MPRESAARVNGRSFAVREYAEWLNAMSDRQYDAMRNGYNTRGARRNIESFEDSLRSFDRELEEYLEMNRAAGFRSVPGSSLINNMLSMWLERDSSGEPAPGVADEWRTDAERAGFRPVGGQGLSNRRGGYQSSPPRGGPRQRSPAGNHRGGYRAGRGGGRASEALLMIVVEGTAPVQVVDGASEALLMIVVEGTAPVQVVDPASEAPLMMIPPHPVVVIHGPVSHTTLPLLRREVVVEVIMILNAE